MIVFDLIWSIKLYMLKKKMIQCGKNVFIGKYFEIGKPEYLKVYDNAYIGPNCWIDARGHVEICSGTILGPRVRIHSVNHNYDSNDAIPYDNILIGKRVLIGENVWIGSDVLILPGVSIGEGVIVAAGSVVTKSVPPFFIVGGNPAKKIKERDVYKYLNLKDQGNIYIKMKKNKVFDQKISIQ